MISPGYLPVNLKINYIKVLLLIAIQKLPAFKVLQEMEILYMKDFFTILLANYSLIM